MKTLTNSSGLTSGERARSDRRYCHLQSSILSSVVGARLLSSQWLGNTQPSRSLSHFIFRPISNYLTLLTTPLLLCMVLLLCDKLLSPSLPTLVMDWTDFTLGWISAHPRMLGTFQRHPIDQGPLKYEKMWDLIVNLADAWLTLRTRGANLFRVLWRVIISFTDSS